MSKKRDKWGRKHVDELHDAKEKSILWRKIIKSFYNPEDIKVLTYII